MFLNLVVVLAVSCSCVARRDRAALRVYRGENASLQEFPFIVMTQEIKAPFRRYCSASLIAETWVLTAAHCVAQEDFAKYVHVRYGDFTLPANKTKLYSKIISAFAPPNIFLRIRKMGLRDIDKHFLRDDIGLLLIERIPNKPTVKLLALDYKTLFGLPARYAGFGQIYHAVYSVPMKYKLQLPSIPLQMGEGVLLPCDNFRNLGPVICVESKCSNRAQGARRGDSGGPLVYDGRIIGVTKGPSSWTLKEKGGTCFTPVSIYLEWIKQVMSANGDATPKIL